MCYSHNGTENGVKIIPLQLGWGCWPWAWELEGPGLRSWLSRLAKPQFPEMENGVINTSWRNFVVVDRMRDRKHEVEFIVCVATPLLLLLLQRWDMSGQGDGAQSRDMLRSMLSPPTLCLSVEISAQLFFPQSCLLSTLQSLGLRQSWGDQHIFFLTFHFPWPQTSKIPDQN